MPSVMFRHTVRIDIHCGQCGSQAGSSYEMLPSNEYPAPWLPDGWFVVNGYAYCPRHVLTIKDLDTATPSAPEAPEKPSNN